MKAVYLQKMLATMTILGMALSASAVRAQESTATSVVQPASGNATAPPLAYGASQILQLAQAKVGEDTIIAYIKNSGTSYGLDADQIIYLKQQGVSSAVITAMLNQPRAGVTAASTPARVSPPTTSTATYVQTVPATTYYDYQSYYSYPAYGYYPYFYPGVSWSLGWGGCWGGGRGYGWHGGGGYGSSWHGGGYGGGWHGGGGFGGGSHGGGGFGGGHGGRHR